jgi:hypothetical protein
MTKGTIAAWLCLGCSALAQAPRTVLDGVYTARQAARGEKVYAEKCASCHEGADVDGPSLTGDPFIERWREDSLAALFEFVKTRMPRDEPGSLDQASYADLIARLLEANRYPAGAAELTPAALDSTLLVGHDGPKPLPTNAMVVAVGCLAASGGAWTLNNAAPLARTPAGDETSPEELERSTSKPLGSASYRLNNAPSPEAKQGHKVQVKGVLGRQSSGDRINVLLLDSLAPACP